MKVRSEAIMIEIEVAVKWMNGLSKLDLMGAGNEMLLCF